MEWIKAVSSEWGDQSKKISLELRPTGGQRVGGLTQSQVVVKICHGTVRKCEWMGHYRQYGIFAFISFALHQKSRDLVGCRQSLTDRRSIDEKAFGGCLRMCEMMSYIQKKRNDLLEGTIKPPEDGGRLVGSRHKELKIIIWSSCHYLSSFGWPEPPGVLCGFCTLKSYTSWEYP